MIRAARQDDAPHALALLRELGYTALDEARFAITFERVLAHAEMRAWIAEDGGRVVGLATLSCRPQLRLGGLIATVDELVVTAGARGRGVGAALLAAARDEAARLGASRLELVTNKRREAYARAFYPKNGFREVESAVMRVEPVR